MADCIFCKIASKEIPAELLYDDEKIVAFKDVNPQAPEHIIIIPKTHIEKVSDITEDNKHIVGELILAATKIARQLNIEKTGYRLVINCNEHGGQAVFHIHLHLLGGRQLNWPPG